MSVPIDGRMGITVRTTNNGQQPSPLAINRADTKPRQTAGWELFYMERLMSWMKQAGALAIGGVVMSLAGQSLAQYVVPSDTPPSTLLSNQSLQLLNGGTLPVGFNAGQPGISNSNVVVDIQGGVVSSGYTANDGSITTITGGTGFSNFTANPGSEVIVDGLGFAPDFLAFSPSFSADGAMLSVVNNAEMAGFTATQTDIDLNHFALVRGTMDLTGGSLTVGDNSNVVGSLSATGTTIDVDFGGLLAGELVLMNSTTTFKPGSQVTGNQSFDEAYVLGGSLLVDGAYVDAPVNSLGGASVVIRPGSEVLRPIEVDGSSSVIIEGGQVAGVQSFFGGMTEITGGVVQTVMAGGASEVTITDGLFQGVSQILGVETHISGGTFNSNISVGAPIGQGEAVISGGAFNAGITVDDSKALTLEGTAFWLNGVPIDLSGGAVEIPVSFGPIQTLTGTLADGSSFNRQLSLFFASPISMRVPTSSKLFVVAVPEPTVVMMATCCGAGLMLKRRRALAC